MKYLVPIQSTLLLYTLTCLPAIAWSVEPTNTEPPQTNPLHIRTLAASCAACHGVEGNSVGITPSLAGLDVSYFISQMMAFKDGSRAATVMHRHAKGLQVEEINALAQYFSQQKRLTAIHAPEQQLKANHAD